MQTQSLFDVIIIGGSYSGLSAAMALGRSLRKVAIIDSGEPCNRQTPHSHNFITHDGSTPASIAEAAKKQVLSYPGVEFISGKAIAAKKNDDLFEVHIESGASFHSKKLLLTTGLKDLMPAIEGFGECWGISVLHCPYCHGYEVHGKKLAIIANGDMAFEMVRLISNWSPNLLLFTNGASTLTGEQKNKIQSHGVPIHEGPVNKILHEGGYIKQLELEGGNTFTIDAVFSRIPFEQHCPIPKQLGCELTETGFIKVDELQRTTVGGVYAAGDNATFFRAVSMAVASGTMAGAVINKELIDESF